MQKKGFTLIELLIVVAILGILAAVGAVVIPNVLGNAKSTCAEDNHKKMIISRESETWRNADRYLSSFEKIRMIQTGILDIGKPLNWKTIDLSAGTDAVKEIAHWFDLEWNRAEQKS